MEARLAGWLNLLVFLLANSFALGQQTQIAELQAGTGSRLIWATMIIPFFESLLRIGIGQTRESLDWLVEGERASILGLPNDAVIAAPQGQLGLGGT
jgi:hypothetical protein